MKCLCFLEFLGDLKNENSVLEWVLNSDNRELDDAIEAVNMKMLNKLLQSSPFMAVFFCKFYHQTLFFPLIFRLLILLIAFKDNSQWAKINKKVVH